MATALITLSYLMGALGAVYLLVPWVTMRRHPDLNPGERLWCAFLFGAAYWIALFLLLAPLGFHDTGGVLAASLVASLGHLIRRRRLDVWKAGKRAFHRWVGRFLDALDEGGVPPLCSSAQVRLAIAAYAPKISLRWDYPRLLIWAVFLYGAYLRVSDSVTHYSFGFAEPYFHLVWLKQFNRGDLFADGVHPRGYHAFLSALGTFSGLGPADLIRFTGGVFGALLPPALYFLLLQCRLPWSSALVGTALVAVTSPFQNAVLMERQAATLPQEFALVFALAALGFGIRYLRRGHSRDCWAFFCGGFVAWSADSGVGMAFLLATVPLAVDTLIRSRQTSHRFFRLVGQAGLCTLTGNLPVMVGRLFGHPFHASPDGLLSRAMEPGTLIAVLAPAALAVTVFGLTCRRAGFPSPVFPSLWFLILFGLWALKVLIGMNAPISLQHLALLLPFAGCSVAAWLYALIVEPLLGKWVLSRPVRAGCVTLVVGGLIYLFGVPPPRPVHPQYEEAAGAYYELMSMLPRGAWTVVGQTEDHALALDRGYYMSVPTLLDRYPARTKPFRFQTPYLVLIVEKNPKQLPKVYESRERSLEESLLQDWVRVYAANHRDLRLYQETENVAVYVRYQPPPSAWVIPVRGRIDLRSQPRAGSAAER